jgi:hypothetical protein
MLSQCIRRPLPRQNVTHNLLWTPIRYNTGEPNLFQIVCNVRPETKNCMAEVPIGALHDFWHCHTGLLRGEDQHETAMVKLVAKNLIFWPLVLAFARLKQSTPQQRSQHNKLDYNEPFGIGRKAMGTTVGGSAHTRLLRQLDRFTPRSNSHPRFVPRDPLVINSQRNFIYLVFIYFVLLVDTPSAVSLQTSEVSSILYHSYCSLYLSCTSSRSLAFLQVHTNTF